MKAITINTASFSPQLYGALDTDERLQLDVVSWWKWRNPVAIGLHDAFESLYLSLPEFRSLARYRLIQAKRPLNILPQSLHFTNDLYISTDDIGGGLRIQHGHSTWIMARRIGTDCHINQNVTIGVAKGGKPTIGNRVKICAGAVVAGNITIGDDVVIAPNCFVNFDVPPGKKVFPARAIII